jgi:hypothetical protein
VVPVVKVLHGVITVGLAEILGARSGHVKAFQRLTWTVKPWAFGSGQPRAPVTNESPASPQSPLGHGPSPLPMHGRCMRHWGLRAGSLAAMDRPREGARLGVREDTQSFVCSTESFGTPSLANARQFPPGQLTREGARLGTYEDTQVVYAAPSQFVHHHPPFPGSSHGRLTREGATLGLRDGMTVGACERKTKINK